MKKRYKFKILLLGALLAFISLKMKAQTAVDINLNVVHSVGGVDTFEREKYMTLHSSQSENDFRDHLNLMPYLLNDLDVYLGREVGAQGYNLGRTNQDPARPGYPDINQMQTMGSAWKSDYAAATNIHQYESKNVLNISTHDSFFPHGQTVGTGWLPAGNDAIGEWLANYIKYFYGSGGQPTPEYFSIINEPEFLNITPFSRIADYHNVVADKVRALNPDIKIGGYTSAGSQHEVDNFESWNKEWKTFIDIAGANMDYFDVHWYDSPFTGFQFLREGANLEASFDMLEQYSKIKLGTVKPFLVSEYGSFIAGYKDEPYTKKRDWTNLKAFSSMLMNYLDRPNQIIKSVPFMIVKAEWGRDPVTGYPHPYRLLRQENGTWVYTEFIKFFELWSDVKGTRVDSKQTDLDIQTETYVDGNKAYVIINNLDFETRSVAINLFNDNNNPVQNVKVKHLYLNGEAPALDVTNSSSVTSVNVAAEATAVLEYTFANTIQTNHSSEEKKYYATSYLKPIVANQALSFNINGISAVKSFGEAVLRVSFGRDHGATLKPVVTFNGQTLDYSDDYRGYDMKPRFRWFGTLEIPVPYNLLSTNNTATVTFSDGGGHVSSVTMQVYDFSKDIRNQGGGPVDIAVTGVELTPATLALEVGAVDNLTGAVIPSNASDKTMFMTSNNTAVATVNQNGEVTAIAAGNATITATTTDGGFTDNTVVTVGAASGLPSPWQTSDIGAVAAVGDATGDGSSFSVNGSGSDIWGAVDEFRYVYQTFTGDVEITARVTSQTNSNTWAKAGVMIRTDLSAGSKHASTLITPGQGVNFQRRVTSNSSSASTQAAGINAPVFVKMKKEGMTVTSSYSSDGSNWTNVGSTTVSFGNSFLIGLAVTSHNDGVLSTVQFTDVTTGSVSGNISVTGVNLTPASLTMNVGDLQFLTGAVIPSNASDKTMYMTSSNTAVATVNQLGQVDAISNGIATITATTTDGGFTDNTTVTIEAAGPTEFKYDVGTTSSVVFSGYTRLSNTQNFGSFGWANTSSIGSRDRGAASGRNDINRDINFSASTRTFTQDVSNATWNVLVTFGDTYARNNMNVKAEGVSKLSNINTAVGQYRSESFDVDVTDGKLDLEFSVGAGGDVWSITRIWIRKKGTNGARTNGEEFEQLSLNTLAESFNVYPNPSNGLVNITGLPKGSYDATMYNMTGAIALKSKINFSNQFNLNVTSLQHGLYILRIVGNDVDMKTKITIE